MGLALEVGILADLHVEDPDGYDVFRGYFESLNRYLATLRMQPHTEPESCDVWSAELYGYSGLHYLRRLAAHVDTAGKLPTPGGDKSSNDPVLEGYFDLAGGKKPGMLSRLFGRPKTYSRGFDHLILHSDAEGFYLPVDFPEVLFPPDDFEIPGGMVGSAPRLLRELERLSSILEIPAEVVGESDELCDAAEHQGIAADTWQRYGIESHSCVLLSEGCRKAISTGAALVFV